MKWSIAIGLRAGVLAADLVLFNTTASVRVRERKYENTAG